MPWTNQDITLYHGTSSLSVNQNQPINNGRININSNNHGISLGKGNLKAEFGPGFYTTTSIDQAIVWANVIAKRKMFLPRNKNITAIVISFNVDRLALSRLNNLCFVTGTNDFWDLVAHCRSGNMYHIYPNRLYDVVYGPVTKRGYRSLIRGGDQVSFHTDAALNVLPGPIIINQWQPRI